MLEQFKEKYVVKKMPDGTEFIPSGRRDGIDHIYAIGDNKLGLWLTGSRKIKSIQSKVTGLELIQDGDGEGVLAFSPDLLDRVARFARARKRRHLTEEHKRRLVAAGKQSRF